MKQRGRKAAESATVTPISDRRAEPPADLNEFQAGLWREIVETRPADWFRKDTYPLLRAYCKHAWHASVIDRILESSFERDDPLILDRTSDMLKARERESRAMLALARSMRITQQAQYDAKTAARHKTSPQKLWEPH